MLDGKSEVEIVVKRSPPPPRRIWRTGSARRWSSAMVGRGRSSLAPPSFSFPFTSPWDDRDGQLYMWTFVSEPSAEILPVCKSMTEYGDVGVGVCKIKIIRNLFGTDGLGLISIFGSTVAFTLSISQELAVFLSLKGQFHEIFCFRYFHESPSPELWK